MFGKLFGLGVRIVTLPLDVGNAVVDNITGGDMSSKSRNSIPLTGDAAKVRDKIAEELEKLDD